MEYKITKVKLSDDSIYSFFDKGAIRLNDQGILVTGDTVVDRIILNGHLSIKEIDDVDVSEYTNILVQNNATGEIARRNKDNMLEDIGGCSYKINSISGDENGKILSLKIGKQ